MLIVRWFLSKRVRHAVDACRQVRRLVRAQRDLLAPEAIRRVEQSTEGLWEVLRRGGTTAEIDAAMDGLERTVQKNLQPYPHPRARENIEVFLVTGAVVLALRTFFIQPMAIPTGSAQPTLWGIQATAVEPGEPWPGLLRRWTIDKWWSGISYIHIVAQRDGALTDYSRPRLVFPFVRTQTLTVGGQTYRRFFPSSFETLQAQAQNAGTPLTLGRFYRAGDDVLKLKVVSGDHLFVNRTIYNFRPPTRGEIIVFSSEGLSPPLMPNTHYIKRLVGLGGERVQIGDDRHLIIDGQRLDASTPGFENVYSFNPRQPPRKDRYSGHVNGTVAMRYNRYHPGNFEAFPDSSTVYVVPPKHLLAMGDNTMNSHDGRAWGAVPQDRLVGRASFVFWPISERFGWGYR
jgi:signal peptidase I